MRLTCWTRSAVRTSRSRLIRRRSSSWGVGAWTIAQTRGSPRLSASKARTKASPSIRSVFARRRRRDVAMEAGSTTWLSIPSFCRTRWIQNPSSPASWMTMIGKTRPVRVRAFSLSWAKRARRAAMSPLRTECFDIFSPPPGESEVTTQVERLSSRDTKIALRSVRTAGCSSGRGQRACMVAPEWVVQHLHSASEWGATNRPHGIFKGRHFEAALILQAVSWYLRYPLSYRDIEELFQERGLAVDHSTLNRCPGLCTADRAPAAALPQAPLRLDPRRR